MQISKLQSVNNNTPKTNFKALKKIKFENNYIGSKYQETLIDALKQSKGVKEFFEKYNGTVTFTTEGGFGGLGNRYADAIMKVAYKTKGKLFSLFPKKTEIYGTSSLSLDDATKRLCDIIKNSTCKDLDGIDPVHIARLEQLKMLNKDVEVQLKNNSFFE